MLDGYPVSSLDSVLADKVLVKVLLQETVREMGVTETEFVDGAAGKYVRLGYRRLACKGVAKDPEAR